MVLGLARTGTAAARFLAQQGAEVLATDRRSEAELGAEIAVLGGAAARYFLGGEKSAWLDGVDLVIPSPGVPPENPLLREAARRGIRILSEIELGYRFVRAPLIGFAGGEWSWGVVEVSSFQLEWTDAFRPKIAALLNLTEDHLDRYPDFAAYGAAKERIFRSQQEDDVAILNRDDPRVWFLRTRLSAQVMSFGLGPAEFTPAIGYDRGDLIFDIRTRHGRIGLKRMRLAGRHNIANAMAAAAAALVVGIEPRAIEAALADFAGLPHRMEFVAERAGVTYIDDSKGTNVAAVVEALAAVRAPVILIAGGMDKGGDYAPLREPLGEKVRLLILIGAARDTMRAALEGATGIELVLTLDEAVRHAAAAARRGDIVLLSPACSSFDQFRNYAERGRIFQELVRAL